MDSFFYDIQEINEGEVYDLDDNEIQVEGDFIMIDDFEEKTTQRPTLQTIEYSDKEEIQFNDEEDEKFLLKSKEESADESELIKIKNSDWSQYDLNPTLISQILSLGYSTPTEIQKETLKHSLKYKDIVGAAETGSGKTLGM
jgi:superfamily II DNA/RNA helicase